MLEANGAKDDMSRSDYAYAPPFRDGPGFGPAEPLEEESGRGPILLAISITVLLALIGLIWSSYNQGVREGGRDAPPRILASEEPYKVRPDDPGGVETAHLEYDVFGRFEATGSADEAGQAEVTAAAEDLSAEDVARLLGVDLATAESAHGQATPESFDVEPPADTQPVRPRFEPMTQAAEPQIAEPRIVEPQTAEGPRTLESAGASVGRAQQQPAPATAEPAAPARTELARTQPQSGAANPPRAAAPAAADASRPPAVVVGPERGVYFVQVASFRSQEAASQGWDEFRRRFPELIDGRSPNVARADLGDRGVHYRLRVSGFFDLRAASSFCDQLKAREQECLVVGS